MSEAIVDILIPHRDRFDKLDSYLSSCWDSSHQPRWLMLLDDSSNYNRMDILNLIGQRNRHIPVIFNHGKKISFLLNEGHEDILYRCNALQQPEPDFYFVSRRLDPIPRDTISLMIESGSSNDYFVLIPRQRWKRLPGNMDSLDWFG